MHHSLQIMFILPLMTGHLFWKATTLGGLYRGVPLYFFCTCRFRYAMERINRDTNLLPNTTLGLYALDTCQKYSLPIAQALQLISSPDRGPMRGPLFLNLTHPPLAILMPLFDGVTSVSTVYDIPLVSPLGSPSRMMDRDAFPNTFGVTPLGDYNHITMLKIADRFNWKYIALLYSSRVRMNYIIARSVMPSGPRSSLLWRHNEHDSVSNHQPHDCLLNRLFRRRSKKTSKLRVTGLCVGNSPGPVNSPHKGPVTRKMFPFDGVIMFVNEL